MILSRRNVIDPTLDFEKILQRGSRKHAFGHTHTHTHTQTQTHTCTHTYPAEDLELLALKGMKLVSFL